MVGGRVVLIFTGALAHSQLWNGCEHESASSHPDDLFGLTVVVEVVVVVVGGGEASATS